MRTKVTIYNTKYTYLILTRLYRIDTSPSHPDRSICNFKQSDCPLKKIGTVLLDDGSLAFAYGSRPSLRCQ